MTHHTDGISGRPGRRPGNSPAPGGVASVHLKEAVTTISGARRLIDLCDELMSSPDFDPDQMTTTERELMARVVAYICRTAMSERDDAHALMGEVGRC